MFADALIQNTVIEIWKGNSYGWKHLWRIGITGVNMQRCCKWRLGQNKKKYYILRYIKSFFKIIYRCLLYSLFHLKMMTSLSYHHHYYYTLHFQYCSAASSISDVIMADTVALGFWQLCGILWNSASNPPKRLTEFWDVGGNEAITDCVAPKLSPASVVDYDDLKCKENSIFENSKTFRRILNDNISLNRI